MTAYFVEVWDQFGELEFRRAFSSPEKRLAALAQWCKDYDPNIVSDTAERAVEAFFHEATEKFDLWEMEIE